MEGVVMSEFKERILENLEKGNQVVIKKELNRAAYWEIEEIFIELDAEERANLFHLMDEEKASEFFQHAHVSIQLDLLDYFTPDEAVRYISQLALDDRVKLLEELPSALVKKILKSLPDKEKHETIKLLSYKIETAGRLMNPEFIAVRPDMTVSLVLEQIRDKDKDKEMIYSLYVTDKNKTLLGVLSLRDVLVSSPETKVKDLMTKNPVKVSTNQDQEETARILQKTDFLAIPVVNEKNQLQGIVTTDDALDTIEEEITEDIYDKAGLDFITQRESVRSGKLVNGTLFQIWRIRIPFLVITLLGGMLAGLVVNAFEETLAAVTAVAFFIPVVMDMGGNVGTQSSTIFTRAMVLGQISLKKFYQHLLKEMTIGLGMGLLLGTSAGIIASVWQEIPALGLILGLSLIITITVATGLGFLIPYILLKLGYDQAAGSDPIITTIKDITGLMVYFILVSTFLSQLI